MPSPLGLVDSRKMTDRYKDGGKITSIFNKNTLYYRPVSNGNGGVSASKPHGGAGSDLYDISTNSIIEYTSDDNVGTPSMVLRPQDFAYLKDFGVYPNNRLVVLRRFPSPVGNDLISHKDAPISTLITWFKGESNPLKISFGEKWENGEGDLIAMLDNMFGTSKFAGGLSALDSFFKGGVPMPGFSEGLQFQLLQELGMSDAGVGNVPSGNPNLIQESKRRVLVDSKGGTGLKTEISIDFETTYEQKFIGGNDPTLVYMDILNNILRFGSSESSFYINGDGGDTIKDFLNKYKNGQWLQAISIIVNGVVKVLTKIVGKIFDVVKEVGEAIGEAVTGGGDALGSLIGDAMVSIGAASISKFRVQLGGIISALTGEASTPWHVTIGNPKAPIFSSGDMYTEDVTIELGEVLAFNDLPSTIKVTCKLKNARSLGIQEIFEKFNSGKGRSYVNNTLSVLETPLSKEQEEAINVEFQKTVKGTGDIDKNIDKAKEKGGEIKQNSTDQKGEEGETYYNKKKEDE